MSNGFLFLLVTATIVAAWSTTSAQAAGADPPIAAPIRIALLSDTHSSLAADKASYDIHFESVIDEVNAAHVDGVLIAGDLTQGGKPAEIADFASRVRRFAVAPRYVFGNHDVGGKHIPSEAGGVTSARVQSFESKLGPAFWATTVGNGPSAIRVIGFTGSLLGSGLQKESDQWRFLEAKLAEPNAPRTLLLLHYPLFLKTADESGGEYWNLEPEPRKRLLTLIDGPNSHVIGVLSGHLHRALEIRYRAIPLITTPPVSFGLPAGKQPEGWTLLTVSADGHISTEFHAVAAPEPPAAPPNPRTPHL
jgi:3',5'-cyclic AMP phosphodiesterase CpdA